VPWAPVCALRPFVCALSPGMCPEPVEGHGLPTAHVGHLAGQHSDGRKIGVQWQTRHVDDRARHIGGLDKWLDPSHDEWRRA
jgi:hypothetical protein